MEVSISHTPGKEFTSLEKVRLGCVYRRRERRFERLTNAWQAEIIEQGMINTTEHGDIDQVTLQVPDDEFGIGFRVTFGIVQEYPLVIWKVELLNHGSLPVEIEKIDLLRINPEYFGQINYSKATSNRRTRFLFQRLAVMVAFWLVQCRIKDEYQPVGFPAAPHDLQPRNAPPAKAR